MATNKIYSFAQQSLNILSDEEYEADQQRLIGHQPGIARAGLQNKASKQSNIMAAALAQFSVDHAGQDIHDSMPVQEIAEIISEAVKSTAVPDIATTNDINAGTAGKLVDAAGLSVAITPATINEIISGATNKLIDAAGMATAFTAKKAIPGYMKLSSGLIIQWGQGTANISSSSATATFPIAFPNAFLAGFVGENAGYAWYQPGYDWCTVWGIDFPTSTKTAIHVMSRGIINGGQITRGSHAFTYLAIGY